MPNNFPAGFVPDKQQNLPAGFVPDAANVSQDAAPIPGVLPDPAQQAHQQLATRGEANMEVSYPQGMSLEEEANDQSPQMQRMRAGESMAVPEALLGGMSMGAFSNPLGAIRKVAQGAVGSYAGNKVGGTVGGMFGDEGRKVGGALGAIGGGLAAASYGLPRTIMATKVPAFLRNPEALEQEQQEALGAFMNRGYKSSEALGRIADAETALPDVMTVPEPNDAIPGIPEGSMFSTPRAKLPGLMESRTPGATIPYRATGGKIIFKPGVTIGTK